LVVVLSDLPVDSALLLATIFEAVAHNGQAVGQAVRRNGQSLTRIEAR
jgi:hypothetical protein